MGRLAQDVARALHDIGVVQKTLRRAAEAGNLVGPQRNEFLQVANAHYYLLLDRWVVYRRWPGFENERRLRKAIDAWRNVEMDQS